ncbi:hypothetical protein MMC07_008606 [Pseudocyphellaria aurata]|nr:hypothetical protein [Pseudocyphellaria aurata]
MTRYFVSALAFAACVRSQCSTSGTTTIVASSDATALASCTTYSGSVAIETSLSTPKDSNGHQQLEIDKIQKIDGNLTVTNLDKLTQLSFPALQTVIGLELGSLNTLTELSFPALTTVTQLNFTALASLQQLNFGNTGITKASSILITNTGLTSLNGITNLKSVDVFNINNNQALTDITLKVTNIKNSLDIEANDILASGLTTSFPFLETAQNMTFRNCSVILLPSLANVTDDLGFYGNDFQNFTAPNLTTAGGLVFVDNTELTNISLPALTSINGTYQIANNTKLSKIDGFQALSVVTGALDFSGNFTEVDLPALTQVKGAFNLQTSGDFDCSAFNKIHDGKAVIRGKYTCSGGKSDPGTADSTSTSTSTGSSASKTAAAAHFELNAPIIMGGSSLVAGLLQFLL